MSSRRSTSRLFKQISLIIALLVSFLVVFSNANISRRAILKGTSSATFIEHLDRTIPSLMDHYHIPGTCIALISGGKTIWTGSYGLADIDSGEKMSSETYFRVESISKSVTSWGIMKLIETGLLDLDAPVQKYLQNWNYPPSEFSTDRITVRMLLSQTSGMPLGDFTDRYSPLDQIPGLEESLTRNAVPFQEPGLSFSYSNTGFNLLELVAEQVSGKNFSDFMSEEVLIPLGMRGSTYDWNKEIDPLIATGHDHKGNPVPLYVYPQKGAGGLFSTVNDIADFVSAGMKINGTYQNTILTPESVGLLYTPMTDIPGLYGLAFENYGLGYFLEDLPDGHKAVSHGGQGYGWMTDFHSVPETGDGIVILTNSQRSWPLFAALLKDWAECCGFDGIGMQMILTGEILIWILIGLVLFICLFRISITVSEILAAKRILSPVSAYSRGSRLFMGISAVIVLTAFIYCINQDYLVISSLFPSTSAWLAISALLVSFTLLGSALFPQKPDI